jgi:hypothetical protein
MVRSVIKFLQSAYGIGNSFHYFPIGLHTFHRLSEWSERFKNIRRNAFPCRRSKIFGNGKSRWITCFAFHLNPHSSNLNRSTVYQGRQIFPLESPSLFENVKYSDFPYVFSSFQKRIFENSRSLQSPWNRRTPNCHRIVGPYFAHESRCLRTKGSEAFGNYVASIFSIHRWGYALVLGLSVTNKTYAHTGSLSNNLRSE